MFANKYLLACVCTLGGIAGGALITPCVHAQGAAQAHDINLAAQPLSSALAALSKQTGIQVFAAGDLVAGKQAPAVTGRLTARDALVRLLAGSGLEAAPATGGGFVLQRARAPKSEQQLPEVKVTGSAHSGLQPKTTSTVGPLGSLPLLDVPYTVTVVPQELIRNENPTRLTEALRYVPGIVNNQPGGSYYDQVFIRGFDTNFTSNYRKNNLPLVVRGDTAFENIEQLEIYKGPSAMFYGFSAPGGVINYVTKRPPPSGFLAGIQAGVNEYGGWRASGDVGGRFGVNGDIGYRVNLGYEGIRNHIDGFEGRRDIESVAFDWKIGGRTLLQLDYDQQYKRTHIQPGIGAANAAQIPDSVDPRKFLGQSWTYHISDSRNTMVQLTHAFTPDWSMRLAGNYLELERPYKFSNVGLNDKVTGAGLAFFGILENYYDAWSGVVQLDGKVRTGTIQHELMMGYAPQRIVYDEYRTFPGGALFNVYNPTPLPEPFAPLGALRRSTFTNRSSFLIDRVTFSESWQAIVGARHNDYVQSFTGQPTYDKTKVTPTLGLIYKPRPYLSVYGSYMEGLERGGVAPITAVNAGELMPPLVSKQYEVGVKADLSRGITLSAALFDISRPSEFNSGGVWVQDGKQVNRGVEFAVAGKATSDLSLYGGFTLLNAELQETGNAAMNGKAPAGVPEQALSLYADYRIPAAAGWYVSAGIVNVGKRPVFADNSGSVPSYTLLNLGARYEFKLGRNRARVLLNLDNATDEFYWDSVDSFGTLTIGVPRTFRITGQLDF
jgi:iron complex outermembrane receptor protein